MGVNRKLLPIKAYYFLSNAGNAPVTPFIPIIARDLGFSSVAVGWMYTAAPILSIFMKPLVGSVADKYSCQKLIFLITLIVQAICLFSIQWAPSLPSDNSVAVNCSKDTTIQICSKKLTEECYSEKILQQLNSTLKCKVYVPGKQNPFEVELDLAPNYKESILYNNGGIIFQPEDSMLEDACILLNVKHQVMNGSTLCVEENGIVQLFCDNELRDLIQKPKIDDSNVMFTYQFWIMFTIIVGVRILQSLSTSIGDTLCFSLLGDRRENFGMQRMWGAVGWGLFSIITGLIVDSMSSGKSGKNYSASFYLSITFFLLTVLDATLIKVNLTQKSKSIVSDVKQLFRSLKNIIFIIWCVICGIYVSFVWNYLFWFIEDLASRNGCDDSSWIKTLEGLVLTIHCYAGEIPFFFMSGWILKKIGHINAMSLVLITFGIRFLLYSILTDPWWILPIESLNGITFGIFYATMTTYASAISPPGTEATVQNIVGAVFEGAGTGIGGLLGGYLFKVIGSSKTFFVVGSSAVAIGILHITLQWIFRKENAPFYRGVTIKRDDADNECKKETTKE